MFLSYITLAVALSLSVIAAYYSIAGLAAIFAAAVIPIIVMGGILEVGKVVVTLWLHEYWRQCRFLMKVYLVPAVAVLMLITSMGIFGFLSKAHSDQSLVGGDVQAKIAIYDEKIKTEKENIETARRALKQMDEGVDQVLGRSTSETGADRAVALRRSQQKERGRLLAEISQSQKSIAELNETRAPIAAEIRKVEAEVGPLKYIAKLIYGDNPDANLLEKAVTWVIIIIVAVFDPLAIMMLLAATESMKWEKKRLFELLKLSDPAPEPVAVANGPEAPTDKESPDKCYKCDTALENAPGIGLFCPNKKCDVVDNTKGVEWEYIPPMPEKSILEQHPYLTKGFNHFENLTPMVYKPELEQMNDRSAIQNPVEEDIEDGTFAEKAAQREWKKQNPGSTIKSQRTLLDQGRIDQLPWLGLIADNSVGFGNEFPSQPTKGDLWVKTESVPTRLFKFNGTRWIKIDKDTTDSYTYNTAYIDHLINKISSGEYDIDLLSDAERERVEQHLRS